MKHQAYENADIIMDYLIYVCMGVGMLLFILFVLGIIMVINELR